MEEAFCLRIIAGDNGAKAARAAGYAVAHADVSAAKLLKRDRVKLRISALKQVARTGVTVPAAGPMTPDVSKIVLDRGYLIQRLLEIQVGHRDSTALAAVKLLGQEEFSMFADLSRFVDPSKQSTDELTKEETRIRKKLGLVK